MHTIPPYYEVSSVDTAAPFCVSVVTWVVRWWKMLPEETVESPPLQILKTQLDAALTSLLRLTLLWAKL